jgi:general secretion pathway protein L
MSTINPSFSATPNAGASSKTNATNTTNTISRDFATRLPRPLSQLWRWWGGELRPVFSPLIDKYWVDHANMISVAVEINSAGATLPANVRLSGKDVRILLPAESVLHKTVNYPEAVEENLAEVVMNDLDRQTPFTPAQVYLANRLIRRFDGADGVARIDVALSIAMKKVADAAIAKVVEAGGRVYSLGFVNDQFQTELLPESARPARRLSQLQKMNIALLVLLCVLVAVAIVAPIVMKRNDVKMLTPLVEKARSEAEATRKVEAEFQRLQAEYLAAVGKKYANYQVIDILEDLTRLSPDTTWMQSFELKTAPAQKATGNAAAKPPIREIKLEGEATSAAKMIELIEQSRFLQNTTQRAQTNRGAQPNTEFFRLSTEVKPRVAPELADLLAPEPAPAPPTASPTPPPSAAPLATPPTAVVSPTPTPNDKAGGKDAKDAKDVKADMKGDMKGEAKGDMKAPPKNGSPPVMPVPAPPSPVSIAAPPSPATTQPVKPVLKP